MLGTADEEEIDFDIDDLIRYAEEGDHTLAEMAIEQGVDVNGQDEVGLSVV